MAETTKISWCDATFNPWMGCTKVSEGCKFCYAERDFDHRRKRVRWGPNGTRVITGDDNWKIPVKLNREAERFKSWSNWVRPRVFCASLSDVFEDWDGPVLDSRGHQLMIDDRFPEPKNWACGQGDNLRPLTMADVRARLFKLIDATPNLDWLLLSKRPENILRMWGERSGLQKHWVGDRDTFDGKRHYVFRENCWIGTTVENQEQADKRIPELLKCRDLASVLFLSCEPLLGPVELTKTRCLFDRHNTFNALDPTDDGSVEDGPSIDWVITGAESGPGARPSDLAWHESIVSQCKSAGVAVFVKQLQLSGKLVTDVNAFPESLRVQEFPARRD